MASAVLALESIVLFLSTPVMIQVSGVDSGMAIAVGLGLAVAALVLCGLLRSRWGYVAGSLLQAAAVGLGFVVTTMFVLGTIFALLWATALVLGRRVDAAKAAREAG
ncbi:MAG: DUF4233 domain-containing protein [Actinomycetota bacterium]|nr:DUF4233 domain-containing protein [Actinomycetota bacterium]